MTLDFFTVLPLTVCVFWAFVILFCKRRNKLRFTQVSIFILLFFIIGAFNLFINGFNDRLTVPLCLFIFSILFIYPLFGTYIQMATDSGQWKKTILYSAMVAGICSLMAFVLFSLMGKEEIGLYTLKILRKKNIIHEFSIFGKMRIGLYWVNVALFYIGAVFFTFQIVTELKTFRQKIKRSGNVAEKKLPPYPLLSIVILFILIATIGISLRIAYPKNISPREIAVISIIYSSAIFLVGIFFISNRPQKNMHSSGMDFEDVIGPEINVEKQQCAQPLIENSKLKEDILGLFQEKNIYVRQNLRVTDVANLLNTNRTYISTGINSHLGCSFNELTNHFRIEYAKKLLEDPTCEKLTLIEISEKVGFSNSNSFYRAFRKKEKKAPRQYRSEKLTKKYLKKQQSMEI